MKKRVLSLLLILCLSLGLLPAGALAAGTQTVKTAVTVDYGAAIEAVEYLNQLRREAGLHDLVMDENLVKSAITRAEMVYHLWQLAGSPEPITSINAFSDLSSLSTQEETGSQGQNAAAFSSGISELSAGTDTGQSATPSGFTSSVEAVSDQEAGWFAAAMCTIKLQTHGPFCGTEAEIRRIITPA